MNERKRAPWLQSLHAVMPLCLSYIPVGLACGVLLQQVGFNPILAGLLSILVFSGGAQFLVASMLATQAPFATTLLMVFFLELRYILLGSSLSGFMKKEKRFFLAVFSQSLNDENYAVNYLKYATDPTWNKRKALYVNWFSMASWTLSNMIGNLFGSVIRVDADLVHFALTAMFIFMFVTQMKNAWLILTGLFSGALGVLLMVLFQNTLGLIAATIIASLAGFGLEKAFKKEKSKKRRNQEDAVGEPLFHFSEQEVQRHD
ncbi:azaleucine resistance protein AzlC [Enterococcus sp. 10A9_DIV0425]|uniref:Azaleucine resistance protein AzlC n=1 Tax=Candidatus Enterococcus wittei TaxID=1987383 RepID=A0A2C9XR03_9ENTE|nr:AzlC family ABC transporter permease [Enterococcus sp. 10A9_DIV0425]OTP11834.1 azaleucine resistance protein AzlC [Enterococcus sp. 10A9_DIV0425]THE14060.1 branched-chain amino acid ABC transporter permease [Enterococcus hirae]